MSEGTARSRDCYHESAPRYGGGCGNRHRGRVRVSIHTIRIRLEHVVSERRAYSWSRGRNRGG